jgi:hypothetical protein
MTNPVHSQQVTATVFEHYDTTVTIYVGAVVIVRASLLVIIRASRQC